MKKIISGICILFLLYSCNWFSSKSNKEGKSENLEHALMQENTKKMKRIFFELPSPIEISLLIKKSGIHYQEDLLNSADNLSGYSTSVSRAIALGVYCADLSYASLNEQYQTSIEYINIARNLAESLGVLRTVDQEKIQLLEENVTDKKMIVDIISEIYMESSEQLREQDRYKLASLMLIGGWIESLYLATQSLQSTDIAHELLIQRVLEQRLSLESIKEVLKDNKTDPVISPIYKDILDLEHLFSESIKSNPDDENFYEKIDFESFDKLVRKVNDIRDYMIH
ncbi:hypothetical protein [Ancylomarina longa]|uniref:Lipoprotein n=1 Tax=Ancylomarina longa TaxID=2487017 RepID=A0A434AZQ1_9BACT|nr:hypothetical protein [Ancylomarina longa]RUT80070.1 hypothetical protein DLK05_01555 [Ancylomarina longa]